MGPRHDWFSRPADLFVDHWVVSDRLDRVGVRLDRPTGAPALTRVNHDELPTEGMALGAIQVPPSGEPVVFLADHPITGGYPVIGVVLAEDVPLLAQARPGQQLVFRPEGAAEYPTVTSQVGGTAGPASALRFRGNPSDGDIAAILVALPALAAATPTPRRASRSARPVRHPQRFDPAADTRPFQRASRPDPASETKPDGPISHLQSARCQPRRNCRARHPSRQRRRLRSVAVSTRCPTPTHCLCAWPMRRSPSAGRPPRPYLDIDKIPRGRGEVGSRRHPPRLWVPCENADFAQAVIDAGLIWIGPSHSRSVTSATR